ncbi:MAG: magnesium/cobalt transporter CorA [Bacteroidetes bacterium]|nr:magnesium/cobalt transporter CorA [Bacteroidota bacterium]
MARKPKQSTKSGLPPGRVVYIGNKEDAPVRITVIDYDSNDLKEISVNNVQDIAQYQFTQTCSWINIDGIHKTDIIEDVGKLYQIHPLILEDIVNTQQRPKLEVHDDYVFIVFKMLDYDYATNEVIIEQVSMILGHNYVISFQENIGDVFEQLRSRIRNPESRFRQNGSDYLVFALLDCVVDNYFTVIEKLDEQLEEFENDAFNNPGKHIAERLNKIRRDTIYIRKAVWPLREMVNHMLSGDIKPIKAETHIYLRDLYDHTIQVLDTIEMYRDVLSGIMDVYLSNLSYKMNEVMKTLTIISSLFIPLTFIVGVYGMNFEHMPELKLANGYFMIWAVMILVALIMFVYMKAKKWL